jgi:thiamine biosynthesis protein ThiS
MAALFFNDKPVEAPAKTTLKELLKLQDRDPELVVVTVDGKFVARSEYGTLTLPEGARVKVMELQAGG